MIDNNIQLNPAAAAAGVDSRIAANVDAGAAHKAKAPADRAKVSVDQQRVAANFPHRGDNADVAGQQGVGMHVAGGRGQQHDVVDNVNAQLDRDPARGGMDHEQVADREQGRHGAAML